MDKPTDKDALTVEQVRPANVGILHALTKLELERDGPMASTMVRVGLLDDILCELYDHRAYRNAHLTTQSVEASRSDLPERGGWRLLAPDDAGARIVWSPVNGTGFAYGRQMDGTYGTATHTFDTTPAPAGELEEMRAALVKCRDQFQFYTSEHHTKATAAFKALDDAMYWGDVDEQNAAKADYDKRLAQAHINAGFVELCDTVLRNHPGATTKGVS